LIENLETHTDILSFNQKVKIIFCYNHPDTLKQIEEAVQKSQVCDSLQTIYKLPSFSELESNMIMNGETLIIFEDLQNYIKDMSKNDQNSFSSYLTRYLKVMYIIFEKIN
jgi:hypothetical protein